MRIAQLCAATDGGAACRPCRSPRRAPSGTRSRNEILIDVILPQLVLIVIAGLVLWVGVARGLAPLRALQQAVAARSHLDLSPVEVAHVPGEVHPLLSAVNDLMARLDDVLSFQNRFIADAAHQLRTPVAGLKAHIEVALREDDPAQTRQSLAHLYTGVERMSRLVAQLLSLARNEPATVRRIAFAPIDLSRLAFDVTMEWVPEAYRKHIDLGFEGAKTPATIHGDTDAADRAHQQPARQRDPLQPRRRPRDRSRRRQPASPALSVSDDGPTIPVEERERVFERFHRLLGAHADGSGLGLAIVREIADAARRRDHADDDVDGVGNTFTVYLSGARVSLP